MEPLSAKPTVDRTATLRELDAVREAFAEAVRRRDPAAVATLYSDGARVVAPDVVLLRGRKDVAAFWGAGLEVGLTDVELEPEDVELEPQLAWEVGRYLVRFRVLEPQEPRELVERGRYLLIYRLDDGRWTRAAEMFAPDAPASGGPRRRFDPPRG